MKFRSKQKLTNRFPISALLLTLGACCPDPPQGAWDFDRDGQDDLVTTDKGLGYDVGGNFVEVEAKGWMVIQLQDGFDLHLDTDGDGEPDSTYQLRDLNGDGDFGESGEVTKS
jgi:hypothetical protein